MDNNPPSFNQNHPPNELKNPINDISIKIKCMDNEFMVDINTADNIELLKQKIEIVSKVPINRQRLIFQGKLLKDEEKVSIYKITNLDVIHMVAKIGDIAPSLSQPEPSPQSRRNTSSSSLFNNFLGNILRGDGTGIRNSSTRTRVNNESTGVASFNESEWKETIVQNITQVNEILQCGNYDKVNDYDRNILTNEQSISCFDFSKRKLVLGQWVDVKDTVNQWLEAQVIHVKDNTVQIHYNKWGTRWDEWIDMSSNRIMPFRFYTRQSSITNYQSPYPNNKPDANINLLSSLQQHQQDNNNPNRTFLSLFDDVAHMNNSCNTMIGAIRNNTTEDPAKKQLETVYMMKRLLPILDRMGRIMIDMSCYVNNSIKKNKLEDLDNNIFQGVQSNCPLLKAYTSDEQKVINEEIINQHIQREHRNGTIHIIPPTNELDKKITNQIPLIDTPLIISNRYMMLQPVVDIYVHTFLYPTPLIGNGASLNPQNNSNEESSPSSNNPLFNQDNHFQNESEEPQLPVLMEENNQAEDVNQSNINANPNANDESNNIEIIDLNMNHTENNNEINNETNTLGQKRHRNDDKHNLKKKSDKKTDDEHNNDNENDDTNNNKSNPSSKSKMKKRNKRNKKDK